MEETKTIEEQHSVKVSINAKKLFSGEVKCYGSTPEEALSRTLKLAKELEILISEKNK